MSREIKKSRLMYFFFSIPRNDTKESRNPLCLLWLSFLFSLLYENLYIHPVHLIYLLFSEICDIVGGIKIPYEKKNSLKPQDRGKISTHSSSWTSSGYSSCFSRGYQRWRDSISTHRSSQYDRSELSHIRYEWWWSEWLWCLRDRSSRKTDDLRDDDPLSHPDPSERAEYEWDRDIRCDVILWKCFSLWVEKYL